MTKMARRGFIIVSVVIVGLVAIGLLARRARLPQRGSVLQVRVSGDIEEQAPDAPFAGFIGQKRAGLRDYLEAILRARDDERIGSLLLIVDRPSAGFAKLQELRDVIRSFRDSGKPTVAYLETAGEFSPGNGAYYLATACESIWLAPPGDINLTGLRAEVPFIRGTLDLLRVVPDFDHIGKYKNFKNLFTEKSMTEAHREAMEALVGSTYDQFRGGIAQGRNMTDEQVQSLIDRGPFLGPQALEVGLVDTLGYWDELRSYLKEANDGELNLIPTRQYLKTGRYYDSGVRLALIYGVGGVSRGKSDQNPFSGSSTMGSDTIAAAIRAAREDSSIKAIVFRVDCPGGSYVASDVIWREVTLTRGKKPIVISMSDVAASGGYFVSMAADRIVAHPGTITASIGVLAGKMVTTGMWDMVGITSDSVQRGRHATFYSSAVRFTPEEREIFQAWLDRIYRDFVGKVAKGRGKSFDEVHAIAQGRVWTGADALKLGLVDELGGMTTAIRSALDLAGLDPDSRVQLVEFPAPRSWLEQVFNRHDTATLVEDLRTRAERFLEEGPVPGPEQVLTMPYVPRIR